MIAAARGAAFEVLRAVDEGQADLPAALARVRGRLPDERDRALTGEIATGTLRWQGAFDHVIAAFTGKPVTRLDPEVLTILRMTIFQILHLDRVPVSAAVNDAVSLTRKTRKTSAAGLVNAVLRRVSRERKHLPLPARPDSADSTQAREYLAATLSHPAWLVDRWLDRYGFDAAEAWARFDNEAAPLMLRANRLKTTPQDLAGTLALHGVDTTPARFAPDGLVVVKGNPLLTPIADDGTFIVQDESSQLVALMAAARPGERILDACAAPGGKTTAMAAEMAVADADGRGLIVATDLRGRRVDLLARGVRAAGATRVSIVQADAAATLPFAPVFDCVLLDAPCSGLGTLRRDPDIRWRRTADDLPRLVETQRGLLDQVARVVKPGGRIVYATCSSEPDENEEVVARFLSEHPEFEAAPHAAITPALHPFLTGAGHFRTVPFRDRLEAFFAAMLVKTKDLR